MSTLQAILTVKDPCLAWVKVEDDLCLAVLYRAAVMHQIGKAPEPEAVCDIGMEYKFLRFQDDSLYCASNGESEAWAQASDFLSENYDALSEQEKEFLS